MIRDNPTIVVVGAGRVGTYLACKLRNISDRVVLKGSKQKLAAAKHPTQSYVLSLCKEAGVDFIRDYEVLCDHSIDYVFITVKTYDLPAVKAELEKSTLCPRFVVLVHNGIIPKLFADSIRVVVPQSFDFVESTENACGVEIKVNNEDKSWLLPHTTQAREIAALLRSAGIHSEADTQFSYNLVRKFVVNGLANLLSIVGNCSCQGLLSSHLERMKLLYCEIIDVLRVPHSDVISNLPEDFRDLVFKDLASYSDHYPSTKMDFDHGLRLETDSLNGYVCKIAREQGIQTPENDRLLDEVNLLLVQRKSSKTV